MQVLEQLQLQITSTTEPYDRMVISRGRQTPTIYQSVSAQISWIHFFLHLVAHLMQYFRELGLNQIDAGVEVKRGVMTYKDSSHLRQHCESVLQ